MKLSLGSFWARAESSGRRARRGRFDFLIDPLDVFASAEFRSHGQDGSGSRGHCQRECGLRVTPLRKAEGPRGQEAVAAAIVAILDNIIFPFCEYWWGEQQGPRNSWPESLT